VRSLTGLRTRAYRWSGFAALALAASRLIAVDARRFSPDQRILTFVLAGIALLAVSFVYARREGRQPLSEADPGDRTRQRAPSRRPS